MICLSMVKHYTLLWKQRKNRIKKNIHRSDKARGAYYRHISDKRWEDGKNYQLVLDSSVGIDKTVETIVNYVDMHL